MHVRLARAPARLRRASRLCSRRLGAPSPQAGAALRWGRACVSSRGRAAVPNFAALRADFAHGAKRRDPRERLFLMEKPHATGGTATPRLFLR